MWNWEHTHVVPADCLGGMRAFVMTTAAVEWMEVVDGEMLHGVYTEIGDSSTTKGNECPDTRSLFCFLQKGSNIQHVRDDERACLRKAFLCTYAQYA